MVWINNYKNIKNESLSDDALLDIEVNLMLLSIPCVKIKLRDSRITVIELLFNLIFLLS